MVKDIHHCGKWMIGEIIVYDFKMSVNECISLINASEYGPLETTDEIIVNYQLFKFLKPFHPEKLVPIISKLCDVSADPNTVHCLNGEDVHLDELSEIKSKYTFKKGSGDCPSGCMHEQ